MGSWMRFIICFTAIMLLSLIVLPEWIRVFRPPFVLLYVLYLQFFAEKSAGVVVLFLFGLCVDICSLTLLGEHAFALVFTACYASSKRRRFEVMTFSKQLLLIIWLCFIYQLILQLAELMIGGHQPWWSAALTALMGGWFWPLICFCLGTGRTRFKTVQDLYLS